MTTLPDRPRWLDDEPEIIALLNAVVDRFEQQSGEERSHRINFTTEQSLPRLKRLDESADQLWLLVCELQRLGVLDIRPGKQSLLDAPWKGTKLAFPPDAETLLRHWLNRPAHPSELTRWRELVRQNAHHFPGRIDALMRRRLVIPGHSDYETISALAGINRFSEPVTLRQLSAALFRGDSKLLDDREELIRALFPDLPIRQRAIVVAIHLPTTLNGVLFIENQESYVAASEGMVPGTEQLALVYAAGFRSSAERIREPGGALLHFSGAGAEPWREMFKAWWFTHGDWQLPYFFFGDLDYSGMQILAVLRRRFGEVSAWQPGYNHLLERVSAGGGHTPDAADKQQQIDPETTGCGYADQVLLPAMRRFGFMDQEALIPES